MTTEHCSVQCHTPADKLSSSVREGDLCPILMSYQLAPFLPHSLPFILLKEHFEAVSACQLDPDPIQCWATSVKPLPVKVSPIEVLRPNQIEVLRLIQIVLLNRVDQRLLSALFGFVLQEDKLGQIWHIQLLP